ncbi:hypothetical protein Scep_003781 [Stephania cephalantha]|uniref:Syntaxin 6/10/61 N-terminal domain-containing protein n=1 Tax=Stephania cephalantha TaxID=152367 RepID=A0AAP0PUQ7_9MAGN
MTSAQDPFYIVKEEIQVSIEKLQSTFHQWGSVPSNTGEWVHLTKELIAGSESIEWQNCRKANTAMENNLDVFSNQSSSTNNHNSVITPMNVFALFWNSLSQSVTIKLDGSNFLLWKSIILPVIRGYKLDGYLLGTLPCPSPILESGSSNPAYKDWISMDQLLRAWLLNSLTESVAIQIIRHSTSHSAWKAVEELTTVRELRSDSLPKQDEGIF